MSLFAVNNSYDYEHWPSDLLSWWREVRARVPDNMTFMEYEIIDDTAPGGTYMEDMELETRQISEQEARTLRVAHILRFYYTPSVAVLGLLSSLLATPILARVGRVTRSSHLPYLVGLGVCSLLYLLGLLLIWLGSIGVNVYGVPGTCQFTAFISQGSHFLYTWILVALVTDRLAVQLVALKTCPSWLALMVSPTRAKIILFVLSALALAVFLNLSMMEGTVHFGAAKICVVIVEYLRTSLILDRIDAILNFFIPFLVMVVGDVALILNHCRLKLRRVPLAINDTFSVDPLRPSPSPSTESSTPDPAASAHAQREIGMISPSVSSMVATVATSGLFVILSLPNTIQRTVSTFADDHLLFTMTARGILYQHAFANLFYTVFVANIVLIFTIDADVRRETGTLLHRLCCARSPRACCQESAHGADIENGSDSDCQSGAGKEVDRAHQGEETAL